MALLTGKHDPSERRRGSAAIWFVLLFVGEHDRAPTPEEYDAAMNAFDSSGVIPRR